MGYFVLAVAKSTARLITAGKHIKAARPRIPTIKVSLIYVTLEFPSALFRYLLISNHRLSTLLAALADRTPNLLDTVMSLSK